MRPMTAHEKECAFAAIAVRIESTKNVKERKEWSALFREIEQASLIDDGDQK